MSSSATNSATESANASLKRRKYIVFRLLAIAIGLTPFLICETVLRVSAWRQPGEVQDPYVGFSEVRSLFELNHSESRYEIPESRLTLFRPESFDVKKGENDLRVFCIGGSTVQGRPFAIETSFTSWLEIGLNAADDNHNWDVINCGGVSYASYRLRPIVKELLSYQPDLFVIYTGHNEFLEERTYENVKRTPAWAIAVHNRLSSLRTYSFLRSLFVRSNTQSVSMDNRTELPPEAEAILDYKGGLEKYHRDDQWKKDVADHFALNLRQMVALAREAGVPVILVNPGCKLMECPPFKSELDPALSDDLRNELNKKLSRLRDPEIQNNLNSRIELLKSVLEFDPGNADLNQQIADAYHFGGQKKLAKQHYLLAKEHDVCPLRILEPMRDSIHQTASEFDTPLVDVQAHFESKSEDGITNSKLFLDHVHPTIYGHQVIADLLIKQMQKMNLVDPVGDWEQVRDQQYRRHLEGLDHLYFELGKQRLEGLQRWSQGKVKREKSPDSNG